MFDEIKQNLKGAISQRHSFASPEETLLGGIDLELSKCVFLGQIWRNLADFPKFSRFGHNSGRIFVSDAAITVMHGCWYLWNRQPVYPEILPAARFNSYELSDANV